MSCSHYRLAARCIVLTNSRLLLRCIQLSVCPSPYLTYPSILCRRSFCSRLTRDRTNTDGSDFMGERLTVQFARGARHREGGMGHERAPPRPRRTPHRMQITGLPNDTSWQVCSLSQFVAPGFHGTCMPFSSSTWSTLVCYALHWVGMCAPHYPFQPFRSGLATLAWHHPWFLT